MQPEPLQPNWEVVDVPLQAQIQGTLVWSQTERSEEHTSELQSQSNLVCRLLLEKKIFLPIREPPLRRLLRDPPPVMGRSRRGFTSLSTHRTPASSLVSSFATQATRRWHRTLLP